MAQLIRLPSLSPTMEQGTVSQWHVKEGDTVDAGDLLAEIETDKTTMEFEAIDPGVIGKILVPEGADPVSVNQPIAVLLEEGEPMPESIDGISEDTPPAAEIQEAEPASPAPAARKTAPQEGGRIFASPLARRIAAEKNIDLKLISGSGPRGRIVKSDVENAQIQARPAAAAPPLELPDVASQYSGREFTSVPLDGMRRTVAARLSEANRTIPHFYLRREFTLDPLLHLRAAANDVLADQNARVSINDFVIRAAALALQKVPEANSVWAGDQILRLAPSDIAVAVAIEGGLLTPVIRDAETKSVQQLSVEMKSLAAKARARKLMPAEYTGGTFSVSNLGMFGISSFDAVINPPHASILAVGAAQRKAVEKDDGAIGFSTVMPVTLSCDHRVIDGAVGAQFLAAIAEKIENPVSLLL